MYQNSGINGNGYGEKFIARMDLTGKWTKGGELQRGRAWHTAIYDGQFIMIIGGMGNDLTEKCSIESFQVSCVSQTPELLGYVYNPAAFLVAESFCEI